MSLFKYPTDSGEREMREISRRGAKRPNCKVVEGVTTRSVQNCTLTEIFRKAIQLRGQRELHILVVNYLLDKPRSPTPNNRGR